MKIKKNTEYLEMLDRSIREAEQGNFIVKDIEE